MESSNWNSIISKLPNPHFLQTYEWGQVKVKYGWEPLYAVWTNDKFIVISDQSTDTDNWSLVTDHCIAACLILKRQIIRNGFAARLSVLYSPKGPLLDWTNEPLRNRVLNDLQSFSKKQGAIFLKCDPDAVLGTGVPDSEGDVPENSGQAVMSELKRRGWEYSSDQIQFRNTVLIDLNPSEEEMLGRMKQKTRYNIRLAEKKGVSLRIGTLGDLGILYKMYAETSVRDGFVIRDEAYYKTVWELFMTGEQSKIVNRKSEIPHAEPLIAEVNGEPVAAISCGIHGGTPVLDLDYPEDSSAGTDANFVMTGSGGIVEIQGTAEGEPFSEETLAELLALARKGIGELVAKQKAAIA